MANLLLEKITKTYDDAQTATLENLSLEVPSGSFTTILGPSGCGKSTLLRLVAGLESAQQGRILIGGTDVTALPPARREVAMVFQNYALYPHMTIYANIAVGLKLRKVPKAAIAGKVRETAEMLEIAPLLDRFPKQLSGGQQQRVAIARALVKEPKLFLLDEPLSNLDAKIREKTRGELRKLFEKLEATVLYVTHDQTEAMGLSDQMVVMEGGKIRQTGTPAQIYDTPASLFVARFVGVHRMNIVSGTVESHQFVSDDKQLTFPMKECRDGKAALGFRPEELWLGGQAEGEVIDREYLGAEELVTLRIGENEIRMLCKPGEVTGQQTRIGLRPGKGMLFDPATGEGMPKS